MSNMKSPAGGARHPQVLLLLLLRLRLWLLLRVHGGLM